MLNNMNTTMEATASKHGLPDFRYQGVVLGTVGLAVASAIVLGVFHLMQSVEEAAPREQDTTAYLLSGANGAALRAAVARRKQGRYVARNPLDA